MISPAAAHLRHLFPSPVAVKLAESVDFKPSLSPLVFNEHGFVFPVLRSCFIVVSVQKTEFF